MGVNTIARIIHKDVDLVARLLEVFTDLGVVGTVHVQL